ncbi:hypothetical protein CPB84DRAFT_1784758 [Gymnopilus junonius]|uniref:Uncharacterized protein n=1 Tax=Gymnopilus junonius TaxID=109634 RepID=A0A9P5NII1_GYMJU|nr:hypothetical protein CPB84DRAFT_1784758 [Gymnopilus junonius]
MYKADGSDLDEVYDHFPHMENFTVAQVKLVNEHPTLGSMPSDDIAEAVLVRDNHKCMLTGIDLSARSDTKAIWLLPLWGEFMTVVPYTDEDYEQWADMKSMVLNDPDEFSSRLKTSQNCIITTEELAELLWTNEVTIDTDHGYEIVYFGKPVLNSPSFKTRFMRTDGPDSLNNEFLNAHFRYSLQVNIIGGGINDDFKDAEIYDFLHENRYNAHKGRFMGEKWNTKLGRHIADWLIMKKVMTIAARD